MVALTVLRCFAGALCVSLLLSQFVAAAPPPPNYEGLRDLYQQLLEAGDSYEQGLGAGVGAGAGAGAGAGVPAGPAGLLGLGLSHQVVRKSNRTPSLRLRYGRRSDPAMKVSRSWSRSWTSRAPVSSSLL